jgi:hypothetical protein
LVQAFAKNSRAKIGAIFEKTPKSFCELPKVSPELSEHTKKKSFERALANDSNENITEEFQTQVHLLFELTKTC